MNVLVITLLVLTIIIILSLVIYFILKEESKNFIKQTSPLVDNGSSYTFPAIDIGGNKDIAIEAIASNESNTDPIILESSPDNVTWIDTGIKINNLSGGYFFYNDNFNANYLRFKFVNSSTSTVINVYTTFN